MPNVCSSCQIYAKTMHNMQKIRSKSAAQYAKQFAQHARKKTRYVKYAKKIQSYERRICNEYAKNMQYAKNTRKRCKKKCKKDAVYIGSIFRICMQNHSMHRPGDFAEGAPGLRLLPGGSLAAEPEQRRPRRRARAAEILRAAGGSVPVNFHDDATELATET